MYKKKNRKVKCQQNATLCARLSVRLLYLQESKSASSMLLNCKQKYVDYVCVKMLTIRELQLRYREGLWVSWLIGNNNSFLRTHSLS